jgi:hypothetical protein
MNHHEYRSPGWMPKTKVTREKERTLKDTLLISAWVAAYAGVLLVFRVARGLEGLLSSKEKALPPS